MFYLFIGYCDYPGGKFRYERRGVFESLSDAVWNFYDLKKTCLTRDCVKLKFDTELHLTVDPDLSFDEDHGIILSAFNVNGRVTVRDNIKDFLEYHVHE